MTDAPWEKPSDEISKQAEVDEISKFVEQSEAFEVVVPPPAEQALDPGKQHLVTGITFRGKRLLLETNNQEILGEFKKAYHRLERHFLGDYGD